MSPLRRKIAEQLVSAQQTAAILTTFNECDMSAVMAMRSKLQDAFVAKHGVKLVFMSFLIKAVVDALKAVPQINVRVEGDEIITNHFYLYLFKSTYGSFAFTEYSCLPTLPFTIF